jgi:microcystin degradation protein MlrC
MPMRRIGVASIMQESNTFAPQLSELADFERQGLHRGAEMVERCRGTNTEAGGALDALERHGVVSVPLLRAWGLSSGPLTADALRSLTDLLTTELRAAGPLDGLVLSLHGALVAVDEPSADAHLVDTARRVLGPSVPLAVSLDLHANVTARLAVAPDFLTGYRTYPHHDMAETASRTVAMLLKRIDGRVGPVNALAKVPMLIPPESMQTTDGPMARLRAAADEHVRGPILDVSLFPVQPWLDVPELGFGILVTADHDRAQAASVASRMAKQVWDARGEFHVALVEPADAFERARRSSIRPFVMTESADSPTAGTPGDSPAMVAAWLAHGRDLRTYITLADAPAVELCHRAGPGQPVGLSVGCTVDTRFHKPVHLDGTVERVGSGDVMLSGPGYTGMQLSMGRFAVVAVGRLSLLLTERPAISYDPATFAATGLDLQKVDVVVVRSATNYRAAFPAAAAEAVTLDLPGASTPRLDRLAFRRAPRPLYPIDAVVETPPSWLVRPVERSG